MLGFVCVFFLRVQFRVGLLYNFPFCFAFVIFHAVGAWYICPCSVTLLLVRDWCERHFLQLMSTVA